MNHYGIITHLEQLGDPARAAQMQQFFKTKKGEYGHGDRFVGIPVPQLRKLATTYRELPLPELKKLLASPLHEARMLALFIMVKRFAPKRSRERQAIYDLYVSSTQYVNNWDLVDSSAHLIMGAHLEDGDRAPIHAFARSESLWEKRIAMLATFWYIRKGDFRDALAVAEVLRNDTHDLIHKAVGWMLREIGERDKAAEVAFLRPRYTTMPRTMLRYAIEKFPEEERQTWLKGTV